MARTTMYFRPVKIASPTSPNAGVSLVSAYTLWDPVTSPPASWAIKTPALTSQGQHPISLHIKVDDVGLVDDGTTHQYISNPPWATMAKFIAELPRERSECAIRPPTTPFEGSPAIRWKLSEREVNGFDARSLPHSTAIHACFGLRLPGKAE